MRRAILLAGIAAGTILLFTTTTIARQVSYNKAIIQHKSKVKDLAFCQKAYEIAASFPIFEVSQTNNLNDRFRLLQQYDELQSKGENISGHLEGDMRAEALDLGIDQETYDRLLEESRASGELEAVMTFEQADEHQDVINRLDEVCNQHLS